MLFADIVDSSGTTEGHDPEVVRHLLAGAFAEIRDVLTSHGGTVEKFIGDAVMAVFGVPIAHDDDAERAVRAALTLQEGFGRTNAAGLLLRMGINTGEVVSGDEEHAETLVTGMPVITAQRLEAAAYPGQVLLGELTRQLVADRFRFGPARVVDAKGIGAISAVPVIAAVRPSLPGRVRTRTVGLVGREREVQRLRAAIADVRSARRSARMLVLGPAGIGKTRLAEEVTASLDPGSVLWGHCLPYGQGIALWPLKEVVRARAGIAPTDAPDVTRAKLERAAVGTLGPTDGRAVAARLVALVAGEPRAADVNVDEAQHELAAAVARFLDATRGDDITTVVLEDLHLAEPALIDTLDEVFATAQSPLALLALARPELVERSGPWAGRPRVDLEPLSGPDATRLAASLVEGREIRPEALETVVARADGNPLYLEELLQVVLDRGDVSGVPLSLHGVIAARLDALDPDVKQLLLRGSALGRDLWLDAVPWESDRRPIATCADDAERAGLIAAMAERGPTGTPTHRFKHLLIRDVAYASAPKTERMRLHDHYASWVRSGTADRRREYADAVAYHAEQAFRLGREVEAPDLSRLGTQAFETLLAAAAAARDRVEFRAASRLCDRALALADEAHVPDVERARALGLGAMIRLRLEPSRTALDQLERAIDAARAGGPNEHLVRMLVWRAQIALADDIDAARALFAEAVAAAVSLGDEDIAGYALWVSAQVPETIGALEEQAQVLTAAMTRMRASGADRWLIDVIADLSANALRRADVDGAVRLAEEARGLAEQRATRIQRFKASLAIGHARLAAGDTERALPVATAAFETGQELGGPWALAESSELLGETHLARGDHAAALEVLQRAAGTLDPTATPAMRGRIARIHALLARTLLLLGQRDAAELAARTAASVAPAVDVRARAAASAARALL